MEVFVIVLLCATALFMGYEAFQLVKAIRRRKKAKTAQADDKQEGGKSD